ncbi:hypothetical protein WH47_07734 [Habropoda laboriosa]|uniref:Uncharacterized protein n=1 Tax=Habropoda laboriosa TaxID=597456 RepID=A0A0L7QQ09_9HYME|nr:PREDICTED: uncharacterized protein LOC108576680 [Habropoda laboriosa]KOC60571.1 hypothetical protein WH47_07734 [Habropoda laboriosa]
MSQVCPSSSHQLVAAAVAFRRARRKFPKNYGLSPTAEETKVFEKAESASGTEEPNNQENLQFTSKKCSNARSNRGESRWNDECGENASAKENFLQKPIICSCCRKRNEQCSSGDTLDIVPSKQYNGIAKKNEFSKSDQTENCDTKAARSFATESRNSSHRTSYSHLGRRSPKETSAKLDSVNLLYDRDRDEVDNVKGSGPSEEKPNCNGGGRVGCKSIHRNLRCTFATEKDKSSSPPDGISRNCDFQCSKHSTLDLLRPRRDYYRPNRHRCCHSNDHCHCCCGQEYNSYSSKEKRLASDTCLCSSNSNNSRNCCHKNHATCESTCNHDCCVKNSEKISTLQEQNDEELEDTVATINHKDSLCILVDKYLVNKKCKQKKYFGEAEFSDERTKDECDKSFTSETTCQLDETGNTKQREKYSDSDDCRFRDHRAPIGKPCRHGFGQIFKEGDCDQFKNLKTRLTKTGTCCSAKGTPWRHTF